MQSKLLTVLFLAFSNAFVLSTLDSSIKKNDNSQFIYGKITTLDNDVYEGQIRWGKEEAFWFDFFNSTKPKNDNLKWLSREEVKELNAHNYEVNNNGWNKVFKNTWSSGSDHTHVFACQFGDIKKITVKRKQKVRVEFKNGEHYDLDGGSNDIGETIQINDKDLGNIKLKWDRVHQIEFMSTPSSLVSRYGEPLYGKVKTHSGLFEGYLQWDHDERLSLDELNGNNEDGEMDIEFGKIKSIRKNFRGSDVTLMSGRSLHLKGSNDVNGENRGIIVNTPNYGRIDIPWDEFIEVNFGAAPSNISLKYEDYQGGANLRATVETIDGDKISGFIIYDLDETFQLEILNGKTDNIEYFIPFSALKSITPQNRKESLIKLTNGEEVVLSDKVDVNESNDGLLIKKGKESQYISWAKIEKIIYE